MLWKPLAAFATLILAGPALADEKGDALVRDWIARIPLLQPITAETTITYTFGNKIVVYKHRHTEAPNNSYQSMRQYRADGDFPMDLDNDSLGDNFEPLPQGGAMGQIGIDPSAGAGHPKYLGKETIEGKEYDVVEMHEILIDHFTPRRRMLASLPRTPDGRIALKWYLDSEGVVRRMTFAGPVQVPETYATHRTAFDPPANKASELPGAASGLKPGTQPIHTEQFTAIMVVDNFRKTRTPVRRPGMGDPLFTIPNTSWAAAVFSPDSTLLAITNQAGLKLVSTATGQTIVAVKDSQGCTGADFSQDGKFLAYVNAAGAAVIRTEDGGLIKAIPMAKRYSRTPRLSPDGKHLALFDKRFDIEIWGVETGALERTIKGQGSTCDARFSADGKQLIVGAHNADILVWDTDKWQIASRLPLRSVARLPLACSRDGRLIATINDDNIVLVWDGSKKEPAKKLTGSIGHATSLSFSSDGKSLFVADYDDTSDLPSNSPGYAAWNLETGAFTALRSPWQNERFGPYGRGVISPDGKLAAFSGLPSSSGSIAVYSLR